MPLSPGDISRIRRITGADDLAVISDAEVQAQYDQATLDAPEAELILPYTYVYLLRQLWGYQRTKADRTTDHGDRELQSQVAASSKALLDYWEGEAGLFGLGRLGTGVLKLGLDSEEPTS